MKHVGPNELVALWSCSLRLVFASSIYLGSSLILTGCGGKASNEPSAVQLTDAPQKLVASYCAGFGNCCASRGLSFNAAACESNLSGLFTSDGLCSAPGVFDPQAAGDCFAQLQAELSSCSTGGNTADACGHLCRGTLGAGVACNRASECAPSTKGDVLCTVSATSSTPVCIGFSRGKGGDPCQATCSMERMATGYRLNCRARVTAFDATGTPSCYTSDGLYCSTDSVCQPLLAVGAACSINDPCSGNSYCDIAAGVCKASVPLGASCGATPFATSQAVCVDSTYCSPAGTCDHKKPAGASCQSSDECSGFCDVDSQLCVEYNSAGLYVSATSSKCANPSPN